jgi:hypothetical protein
MDDDCTYTICINDKNMRLPKSSHLFCAKSDRASSFPQIHLDASVIPFVLISSLGQESTSESRNFCRTGSAPLS